MLRKVTLMALLGVVVAEVSNYDSVHSPYTYDSVHSPYTTKYDPLQHYFGVRQDGLLNMDPMIAGLGVGVLNAGYTTIVSLLNAQKTRNVCNKVNNILEVSEMKATDASLAAVTGFQLTKLVVGGTTASGTVTINGKSLSAVTTADGVALTNTASAATSANTGITAADFERYRAVANAANLALQKKIDQILAIGTLSC